MRDHGIDSYLQYRVSSRMEINEQASKDKGKDMKHLF